MLYSDEIWFWAMAVLNNKKQDWLNKYTLLNLVSHIIELIIFNEKILWSSNSKKEMMFN